MQEDSQEMTVEVIQVETLVRPGENRRIIAQGRGHEIVMDMKKEMMGDDSGPTPPELLAMALGGCMVNIARIMMEQKGVKLNGLQVGVSGPIDPSKAMGLESSNPTGFVGLAIHVKLDADLPEVERQSFEQELCKRCALCDTIANPAPLDIQFGWNS
ncbi:OsmC family protein [Desulfatibacillum aliphaticivorans]|uniref:OsmC family protein n=1 Tax=Desulfatibacillum aliphaticivorans TaxID=218208 RepID=B8FJB5_DESAL|nr:OsmC family protein [Desulfatibacillum aliphaticivorans]ACL05584.1 OsmC family protein [Desulfatibacillum aliphaticivorans]